MRRTLLLLSLAACLSGCSDSLENPKPLPPELASKVTGKASIQMTKVWLTVSIYNGSEWNLTDIDVIVENKKTKEQRKFRCEVTTTDWKKDEKGRVVSRTDKKSSIKTLSEEDVQAYIGDFLANATEPGEWSWSIVGVRGFR